MGICRAHGFRTEEAPLCSQGIISGSYCAAPAGANDAGNWTSGISISSGNKSKALQRTLQAAPVAPQNTHCHSLPAAVLSGTPSGIISLRSDDTPRHRSAGF